MYGQVDVMKLLIEAGAGMEDEDDVSCNSTRTIESAPCFDIVTDSKGAAAHIHLNYKPCSCLHWADLVPCFSPNFPA